MTSLNIPRRKYGVVLAEIQTGIVVDLNGKQQIQPNIHALCFDNYEEAKGFSEKKVLELPMIECVLYDDSGSRILVIRNKGAIARRE